MTVLGIYQVRSKKQPEKFYIGGSVNIIGRFRSHRSRLKKGTHWSYKLQNHYNEFGLNDLEFTILCGCERSQLIQFEQYYIDFYNPYFNTQKIADSAIGVKRRIETKLKQSIWQKGLRRKPLSEETKRKIGAKSRLMVFTEESKMKMSITARGNSSHLGHYHSEETKRIISEKKKEWFRKQKVITENEKGNT
jgi:group I intron endonuclease